MLINIEIPFLAILSTEIKVQSCSVLAKEQGKRHSPILLLECKFFGKQLGKILEDINSDSKSLLSGIYL